MDLFGGHFLNRRQDRVALIALLLVAAVMRVKRFDEARHLLAEVTQDAQL